MAFFRKHKFSKKEKFLARWGVSHLAVALIVGGGLAAWLLMWQGQAGQGRVQSLQQEAVQAVANPVQAVTGANKIGGPFVLTNQDGKTVSDKDFAGKYLLVYFGYTSCPDMCPTGLESMSRALDMIKGDVDKVQPLFITVDPARDTPQRLKDYDAAFHPKIVGLTGTADQIAAVAKEYQVYYQKGEGDGDYEIDHSTLIYLLAPDGRLLRTFDEEEKPKSIADALREAFAGRGGSVVAAPAGK